MARSKHTNATSPVLTPIPARAPQNEEKTAGSIMSVTRNEWDEFWSRIWSAVWHVLGLLTVVIAFIGISGFIAYAVYDAFQTPHQSKSTSPAADGKSTQLSQLERQSLQSAFNILLMNDARPCAIKNKGEKISNVRECRLFGVKLGMRHYAVTPIIDKSGYFAYKASLHDSCKDEKEDCVYGRSIHSSRQGFYITIYFNYTNNSPTYPEVTLITLRFDAGAHPYFDAEALRSTFVKVIGPPDYSDKDSDRWGRLLGSLDKPEIVASITKNREYLITLQDWSIVKRKKEADQTK